MLRRAEHWVRVDALLVGELVREERQREAAPRELGLGAQGLERGEDRRQADGVGREPVERRGEPARAVRACRARRRAVRRRWSRARGRDAGRRPRRARTSRGAGPRSAPRRASSTSLADEPAQDDEQLARPRVERRLLELLEPLPHAGTLPRIAAIAGLALAAADLEPERGHWQVPCRHSIAAPQRRHGSVSAAPYLVTTCYLAREASGSCRTGYEARRTLSPRRVEARAKLIDVPACPGFASCSRQRRSRSRRRPRRPRPTRCRRSRRARPSSRSRRRSGASPSRGFPTPADGVLESVEALVNDDPGADSPLATTWFIFPAPSWPRRSRSPTRRPRTGSSSSRRSSAPRATGTTRSARTPAAASRGRSGSTTRATRTSTTPPVGRRLPRRVPRHRQRAAGSATPAGALVHRRVRL